MKVYLAGPDVFRLDAEPWMAQARELCRLHGFEALTPLDHGETEPLAIAQANLELIRKAQIVVANLNPFRGNEPDSGTVFELGYGLALGKKLWGYLDRVESMVTRVGYLEEGARADDRHPTDAQGFRIEDFGLPLNLMLATNVHLVKGDFAACLEAIRPQAIARSKSV